MTGNKKNAMSLKAKIRNMAKAKNISPQVMLQNYFFERFLERLSRSEYQEKFILKGGLLIAVIAGLETRSTMDLDTTIRTFPLDEGHIREAVNAICSIAVGDAIAFQFSGISLIRDTDEYGGYRVSLNAVYENINIPLSIDITSGDAITPNPIKRKIKPVFNDTEQFEVWTYNIETILAEKIETILSRNVANTRPRDYYDAYLVIKTQKFDIGIFRQALSATSNHRGTTEAIQDVKGILDAIEASKILKSHWERYRNEYYYARDITFEDTVNVIKDLLMNIPYSYE